MKQSRVLTVVCMVSAACALSATSWPEMSWAGGYATARFGGDHGHAASEHVSSIYYNPAGLALGSGTRIYVEGLFAYRQASYLRRANGIDNFGTGTPDDDPDALAANSGEASLENILASPFLGVATDLGIDGLAVGAGFYAPFGGQVSWDKDERFEDSMDYPGGFDGSQRWAAISGYHRVLYGTVAVAYRLPGPRLSIGIGVNAVRQSLETIRARNLDGSDDLLADGGAISEGRALLDGTNTSYSVGAGVVWQASDELRLGASYQSMPGFGESELDGSLTSQFGGGNESLSPTKTLLTIPDVIRAGLVYRASPKTEIRVAGDYTRWGQFERHCVLLVEPDGSTSDCALNDDGSRAPGGESIVLVIPRDWQDTFGVRAGASYWFSAGFEVFGGVGYDSNAIPDATLEAGFFDMDKIISTVGVRYDVLDSLKLTGSFTNVFYFERETQPQRTELAQPSRNPDGAGVYGQLVNFLTIGAHMSF